MKKIFLGVVLLFSVSIYSQFMNVATSSAQQMAELITNPNCITITGTPVIKSGSNFAGNPNSVGTFNRGGGSTFNLFSGIVLSTGDLNKVPGPKLSGYDGDGTNAWPSDADMNTFLVQSNFVNASSLEFNFTSATNEIRFPLIFASEEYGSNQCLANADDIILVLLTDITSGTPPINIASIPSIISPLNIRDTAFNTACASSNANFFDTVVNSAQGPTAPTNFLGSTVVIAAQYSSLVPGRQYKLKIVIADRNNAGYDSAVFISNYIKRIVPANLLGPNLTIVNNSPVCEGVQLVLTASAAAATYIWKKDNVLTAQTGQTYTITPAEANGSHTYTVSYTINTCGPSDGETDSVTVDFIPQLITPNPRPLFRCSGSSDPYNFQLNTNTMSLGVTPVPQITYHTDPLCATAALPLNYSGSAIVIYALIQNPSSPCPPQIKSFNLGVTPAPTLADITTPGTQTFCSGSSNPSLNVGTIPLRFLILNGLSSASYGVSYHTTPAGAISNTDIIPVAGNGFAAFTTGTVYVRVFVIGSSNCFVTTSFNVVISQRLLADKLEDVVYCAFPAGYTLPPLANGQYFPNKYNPLIPNSQGTAIPAGTVISMPAGTIGTYSTTIYTSNLITTSNPCTEEWPLKITLIQPSTFSETTKAVCDKYTLPALDYGNYKDAAGNIIPAGDITTTTTIFYEFTSPVYAAPNIPCSVPAGPITITIENKPNLGSDRQNVFTCSPPYTLPDLSVAYPNAKYYNGPGATGGEITNLNIFSTQDVYVYQQGGANLFCVNDDKFTVVVGLAPLTFPASCTLVLPLPAVGQYWTTSQVNFPGTGVQIQPLTSVENSGTYYLYVPLPAGENCTTPFTNEISFVVSVSHPPADDLQYKIDDAGITLAAIEQAAGQVIPQNTVCGSIRLQPIANGKYYTESHFGGGDGGNEIFANTVFTSNTTIYVYTPPFPGTTCDFEKVFSFVINPKPLVTSVGTSVDVCLTNFYNLPALTDGNYYTSPGGVGLVTNLRIEGPTNRIFYVYNKDLVTGCENFYIFKVFFAQNLVDLPVAPIIESCTNYQLVPLANGKYYEDIGGFQGTAAPGDPGTGVEITGANTLRKIPLGSMLPYFDDTIYIYDATLDGTRIVCPDEKDFRVILYKNPTVNAMPDLYFCKSTGDVMGTDLPLITGTNISPTDLAVPPKYYTASRLGGGTSGIEITSTTILTDDQIIYAYAKNSSIITGSTFACEDEKSFKVNIFKVDTVAPINSCGDVALSSLPVLNVGAYFNNSNGTNPITAADLTNTGTVTKTKTVYVYGASGFPAPNCLSDFTSFVVTILPIPSTFPVNIADRTFCDDVDTANDGVYNVPLNQFDTTIKGATQITPEFSVTYHSSILNAENNVAITSTTLSTVYAVVRNSNFAICSSIPYELNLFINKIPEPTPTDQYLCVNNITNLPVVGDSVTLNTNLPSGHTFVWKDKDGVILGQTASTLTTNMIGLYSVEATNTTTLCVSESVSVSVIPSSIAITSYTVTQNFEDNQTVIVIATGANDAFLYQLDGAPFQESNVFENLSSGNHTIIVRDKNGCGDSPPIDVFIINYPKFFTPNGDTFNEKWNIFDLENQLNAKITIFDRSGKLLKQISPSGDGWDGTYNGEQLPSSDYWFIVRYLEDGITKEFKSHFAMKR